MVPSAASRQPVDFGASAPEHWTRVKLGLRYEVALGKMLDSKRNVGGRQVPYLRNQDVQWGRVNSSHLPTIRLEPGELSRYTLACGDVLVCEGGDVGRAAIWRGPSGTTAYQKALHRLRPHQGDQDLPEFLVYLMQASKESGAFDRDDNRATISHLTAESFRQYRFAFPPLDEQRRIAAFLDHETARIDELVQEQERFVHAVEQKLYAVIRHVVTEGIDQTRPIEREARARWLGRVPEHWEMAPLKYLVRFISGNTPTRDVAEYWNGSTPWVSAKDMKVLDLYGAEEHISPMATTAGGARILPVGAVVVVVRGMILAHTLPVAVSRVPLTINQDLKALIPGVRIVPEFLRDYLLAVQNESLGRVEEAGHGTKALRMDKWTSMEVPIPPLVEQVAISERIDRMRREANDLLGAARTLRRLLLERRSALITAAVTGQIDVSTWTPPDDWLSPESS